MDGEESERLATKEDYEQIDKLRKKNMSNNALIPMNDELKAIELMAKYANDSKFFNNLGGVSGIMSIMLYARELGLPLMQCVMGGMTNVMGKITISPQMMNGMIRKAGHTLSIDSNDTRCLIKGRRKDTAEEATCTFSVEDAKRAGIYKSGGGWDKYPADMCFARAMSRLSRRLFPDVIGQSYVEGEIEAPVKFEKPLEVLEEVKDELVMPAKLLNEDQLCDILDLLGDNEKLKADMLKAIGVESVALIPEEKADKIIAKLKAKKAEKKEEVSA